MPLVKIKATQVQHLYCQVLIMFPLFSLQFGVTAEHSWYEHNVILKLGYH